jgi:hypothetical protein
MAYVAFGVEHPNHCRLMFMSMRPNEAEHLAEMGYGNPEQDGYAFLLQTVSEAISQQRSKPEATDAPLLGQAFWASVHGAVVIHLAKFGDPWVEWRSLPQTAEFIIDAMKGGLQR